MKLLRQLPKWLVFTGLLLSGHVQTAPADNVKIWIDKESCDKYDGLTVTIRKAMNRVSIRAYYGYKALEHFGKSGIVDKIAINILGADDIQNKVARARDVLDRMDKLAAKAFHDAATVDEWHSIATKDDITIYCDMNHVQPYQAIQGAYLDSASGKVFTTGQANKAKDPNTSVKMITSHNDPNRNGQRLPNYENRPEWISFTDRYRNFLQSTPNWGLLNADSYNQATEADYVLAKLRELFPESWQLLAPIDALASPEHILLHELLHTASAGHLTHGENDGTYWRTIMGLKDHNIDPSTHTEAVNLLALALEILVRAKYAVFDPDGYLYVLFGNSVAPIIPPPELLWD